MPGPHPEGAAFVITASPAPGKYEVQQRQVAQLIISVIDIYLWVLMRHQGELELTRTAGHVQTRLPDPLPSRAMMVARENGTGASST